MNPNNTVQRHVIAAMVTNEPGVLAHVASMFAARGFNIDSLVVGRTDNPEFSRMTIVVSGDDQILDQVRKQLGKLVQVVKVVDYSNTDFVERDLMLVRVNCAPEDRAKVIELISIFRAKVVDVGRNELMIELTGNEDKLEALIDLLQPFGIVELARTGIIAMPRAEKIEGKTPVRKAIVAGQTNNAGADDEDVDMTNLPPS
ncbi:MAG: acetolactate synthase small subunit [Planctomycetota bacterium]|jgi:acetolactate synthase-1/3 small subunit